MPLSRARTRLTEMEVRVELQRVLPSRRRFVHIADSVGMATAVDKENSAAAAILSTPVTPVHSTAPRKSLLRDSISAEGRGIRR